MLLFYLVLLVGLLGTGVRAPFPSPFGEKAYNVTDPVWHDMAKAKQDDKGGNKGDNKQDDKGGNKGDNKADRFEPWNDVLPFGGLQGMSMEVEQRMKDYEQLLKDYQGLLVYILMKEPSEVKREAIEDYGMIFPEEIKHWKEMHSKLSKCKNPAPYRAGLTNWGLEFVKLLSGMQGKNTKGSAGPDCEDEYVYSCQDFAIDGYCTHSSYFEKNCRRTCHLCGDDQSKGLVTAPATRRNANTPDIMVMINGYPLTDVCKLVDFSRQEAHRVRIYLKGPPYKYQTLHIYTSKTLVATWHFDADGFTENDFMPLYEARTARFFFKDANNNVGTEWECFVIPAGHGKFYYLHPDYQTMPEPNMSHMKQDCKDNHFDCSKWTHAGYGGYCSFSGFIGKNCKSSCNKCGEETIAEKVAQNTHIFGAPTTTPELLLEVNSFVVKENQKCWDLVDLAAKHAKHVRIFQRGPPYPYERLEIYLAGRLEEMWYFDEDGFIDNMLQLSPRDVGTKASFYFKYASNETGDSWECDVKYTSKNCKDEYVECEKEWSDSSYGGHCNFSEFFGKHCKWSCNKCGNDRIAQHHALAWLGSKPTTPELLMEVSGHILKENRICDNLADFSADKARHVRIFQRGPPYPYERLEIYLEGRLEEMWDFDEDGFIDKRYRLNARHYGMTARFEFKDASNQTGTTWECDVIPPIYRHIGDGPIQESCTNRLFGYEEDCNFLKGRGECNAHPVLMGEVCAKTCGMCLVQGRIWTENITPRLEVELELENFNNCNHSDMARCDWSPCQNATCPVDVLAQCLEDYCSQPCEARWFLPSGMEVTEICQDDCRDEHLHCESWSYFSHVGWCEFSDYFAKRCKKSCLLCKGDSMRRMEVAKKYPRRNTTTNELLVFVDGNALVENEICDGRLVDFTGNQVKHIHIIQHESPPYPYERLEIYLAGRLEEAWDFDADGFIDKPFRLDVRDMYVTARFEFKDASNQTGTFWECTVIPPIKYRIVN